MNIFKEYFRNNCYPIYGNNSNQFIYVPYLYYMINMAKSTEISITRTLMSVTKWLGRNALFFFILCGIFGVLTLNDAKIDASSYQIQTGSLTVVDSFTIHDASSYQFFMFITNQQGKGVVHLILQRNLDGGVNETVFELNNHVFIKNVYLSPGNYQVKAEFINQDVIVPQFQTEIMFGMTQNVNITLALGEVRGRLLGRFRRFRLFPSRPHSPRRSPRSAQTRLCCQG